MIDDTTDDCARCRAEGGLCAAHHVGVLPLLAINLGWLRMMGAVRKEQTARQHRPDAATEKAKRRNARRDRRAREFVAARAFLDAA